MHLAPQALCVGLQYGLPLGQSARWTRICLTYPLKPPYAGAARPHPIKKSQKLGLIWGQGRRSAYGPKTPEGLVV